MTKRFLIASAIVGSLAFSAIAIAAGIATSNEFATQTSGKTVVGTVQMIWNAALGYAQPVSSSSPLPTTPSAPASGTYVGQVGGYNDTPLVVPTIQALSYVSGNAIGALQTVAVFRTTAQPSGLLDGWFTQWLGTETVPVTYYVFNKIPSGSTTCADKTAFVLAAADAANLIMPPFTITASAPSVGSTLTSAQSSFTPFSVKNKDTSPTVNLYACAVAGGTFTPAIGDFTYKPEVAQD